jgi:hypothetical protein
MALKSGANRAQKRGKVYHDFVKYSPLACPNKNKNGEIYVAVSHKPWGQKKHYFIKF